VLVSEGTAGAGGNRGRPRKRAADNPDEDTRDLHPDHLQSRILDAQERLYFKRFHKAILALR
jgi:hypothetical protein